MHPPQVSVVPKLATMIVLCIGCSLALSMLLFVPLLMLVGPTAAAPPPAPRLLAPPEGSARASAASDALPPTSPMPSASATDDIELAPALAAQPSVACCGEPL